MLIKGLLAWGQVVEVAKGRLGACLNELSSWTSLFVFDKQRLLPANVINGVVAIRRRLGGLFVSPPSLRNP